MPHLCVRLQRLRKDTKEIATILQFVIWDYGYDRLDEIRRRIWQHNVTHPHPLLLYWIEEVDLPATLPENENNIIKGEN